MKVEQIYQIINDITSEVLGKTGLIQENLDGIVEVGEEIFNQNAVENYTKALVDHIGRMVFVNRVYQGTAPSVLMDSWEYGSVLEKVQADTPIATENETWELNDGESYDQNIFYKPSVSVKFFNNAVTFEVPISITDKQVKSAFSTPEQLNSFMSMILNAVDRSLTIKVNSLVKRTINNFIGETIFNDGLNATPESKSGVRAINLLYLYKQTPQGAKTTLTAENCIYDKEFIRFACYMIKLTCQHLTEMSSLYNIGGKDRFTPRDLMHIVLLENFASGAEIYLQSDTFHNDLVKLPKAETVQFWQGSGTDFSFANCSTINVTTSEGNSINQTGVLGVVFDRDALGVNNYKRYATSNRNNKAEFTNYWYKMFARYFNDFNENFIVFLVA